MQQVDAAAPEEVRSSPVALTATIIEQFAVEEVVLDWDHLERTEIREETEQIEQWGEFRNVRLDVMSIVVPMTGDDELLKHRPSTFTTGGNPSGNCRGDALVFFVSGYDLTAESITGQIDSFRREVERRLSWAHEQVRAWRPMFEGQVRRAIDERRSNLERRAQVSASLNIPIARSGGEGASLTVPVQRKKLRPTIPPATQSAAREPALAGDMYEDVLRTIMAFSRSVERLPKTAAKFKEEEWRDLLLFILNSNYEGAARGEVFNGNGKTDILIGWEDRNVFIGECKVWHGSKGVTLALDQLASYLVYRDTKAALIVFFDIKNATDNIAKADAAIRRHPQCQLRNPTPSDTTLRTDYLFTSVHDDAKLISLALLPIVVPVAVEA
jgi:hypothetical protein